MESDISAIGNPYYTPQESVEAARNAWLFFRRQSVKLLPYGTDLNLREVRIAGRAFLEVEVMDIDRGEKVLDYAIDFHRRSIAKEGFEMLFLHLSNIAEGKDKVTELKLLSAYVYGVR